MNRDEIALLLSDAFFDFHGVYVPQILFCCVEGFSVWQSLIDQLMYLLSAKGNFLCSFCLFWEGFCGCLTNCFYKLREIWDGITEKAF